jgi:hypothetical protein
VSENRLLDAAERYSVGVPDACRVVTEEAGQIDGMRLKYRITITTGQGARDWEVRQASALKEILLWHFRTSLGTEHQTRNDDMDQAAA